MLHKIFLADVSVALDQPFIIHTTVHVQCTCTVNKILATNGDDCVISHNHLTRHKTSLNTWIKTTKL